MECLRKIVGSAAHIAELDEEDLLLLTKMADSRGQIVSHQGEIALTEAYAVHRTWDEIYELLIVFYTAHDSRNTADR